MIALIACTVFSASLAEPTDVCCFPLLHQPTSPTQAAPFANWPDSQGIAASASEPRISNIRKLTFGGQNAECYYDSTGKKLVFQTRQPAWPDEQIVLMNADGSGKKLVSTGTGRCTCSYIAPDGKSVYFSSTHAVDPGPQAKVDMSKGYVWMVNPNFSLYRCDLDGRNLRQVLKRNGYIAETTIAPNGKYMTFTGNFEGDLEIYRANLDGSGIKRLTTTVGYDGGPFVSWDSQKIVFRRGIMSSNQEQQDYHELLKQNLVRPSKLEIWIMDADGSHQRQVTRLGCASFAPFLHPDGKRIIFSSNYGDEKGREFDLFMINVDGSGLERITHTPDFDGFPMFSRDGKKLVWASNRVGSVAHETNIFVADWVN